MGSSLGTSWCLTSCLQDDSLMFFRVCPEECEKVAEILRIYSGASGQLVNFHKSDICFGRDIETEEEELCAQILGVQRTDCHKRYLGLPAFTCRKKKELFEYVRERIWDKIKTWNGLFFSQTGREVLIKSILQAIPNYVASYLKLSKALIFEIHSAIAKF